MKLRLLLASALLALASGCATTATTPTAESEHNHAAIHETYGKVVYFQKPEDKFPLGEPYVLIVQDMPDVKH